MPVAGRINPTNEQFENGDAGMHQDLWIGITVSEDRREGYSRLYKLQ